MKKFLLKVLVFIVPLVVYVLIVLLIDPFNYANISLIKENLTKQYIAENIEPHMYKMIRFQKEPKSKIYLGDSRSARLSGCLESKGYCDLTYNGSSLNEMIETFWFATEKIELDTVIMGINFNLYNKYNKRFWVEETLERNKNYFSYIFNRYTFKSTYLIIKALITKKEISIGVPEMSKEEFWKFQLNKTAIKFFEKYSYPNNYFNDLKEIASYCEKHNTKLIFWIPPNHVDWQMIVEKFGLQEEKKRFKEDISRLGTSFDFDYYSSLTKNKDNYADPMHVLPYKIDSICNIIIHDSNN